MGVEDEVCGGRRCRGEDVARDVKLLIGGARTNTEVGTICVDIACRSGIAGEVCVGIS